MTNTNPPSQKIKANQHSSYGTFTLLGLLLPIIGIIVGIVYLIKPNLLDKKVGEHTIVMSIIGFVLGFILLQLLTGNGNNYNLEISTTPAYQQSQTASKVNYSEIGKTGILNSYAITVHNVSIYRSEFLQPNPGNKIVIIDITQENRGSHSVDYNAYDFRLKDDENFSYEVSFTDKEPAFSYGSLIKDQKVRGFLPFEIPKNNIPTELIFTPSLSGNDQLIIRLRE